MAFDRQNITNQGMYLIRRLGDGCHLSFTAMFTEVAAITPAMMPTGGGVTYDQAKNDTERFSEGIMWNVSPVKNHTSGSGSTDLRAVGKFQRTTSGSFVMRSAYLFATLLDENNDIAQDDTGTLLENILFAVASNDDESVLQSDGNNSLFVTFQLVLTNGFSQIVIVENGVATLQDLENLQGSNDLGKLSMKFDQVTGDLQLFDGNGNLIDQANLPVGSGIGGSGSGVVTVNDDQMIHGRKVWISSLDSSDPSCTLYKVPGYDAYAFVSGYDESMEREALSNPNSEEVIAYKAQVKAYAIGQSKGLLTITDTGRSYDAVRNLMDYDKLRKPALSDFFYVSEDRDEDTPENIGQDTTVCNLSEITDGAVLASLWRGYSRLALEDADVLSSIDSDPDTARAMAIKYPERLNPSQFLLPPIAVSPADFKAVYTTEDLVNLRSKYQEISNVPVDIGNGSTATLSTVTRTRLLRVIKGLYEKQVQNARVAYLLSVNMYTASTQVGTNAPNVAIDSSGITFGNRGQHIKLSINSESDGGTQKLALSRVTGQDEKIFAFIGDSGMLGGAPLFSVRVAAHAHYTSGTKNWLLNELKCSDGFVAEIAGQRYNSVQEPVLDIEKNDHLFVTCADNLNLPQDMTHVVVDIMGYMGCNDTPVDQFKHVGCIVPFNKTVHSQSVNANRFGCEIDLTIPLNSWVQTSVQGETQNTPDVFVVRAYAISFSQTQIPDGVEPELLTYIPYASNAITKNGAYMVDAVYNDGSTVMFEGLPVPLEDGTRIFLEEQSTSTAGGYYWYRTRKLDEHNEPVVDIHGNPVFMCISGKYLDMEVVEPEYEGTAFNVYCKVPSGTAFYSTSSEDPKYFIENIATDLYAYIPKVTTNDFYAFDDITQPYGMRFTPITPEILLDTIEDHYESRPSDDSISNVPVFISGSSYQSCLSDGELCNVQTHSTPKSGLVKKGWEDDPEEEHRYSMVAVMLDTGMYPLQVVQTSNLSVMEPEVGSLVDTSNDDPLRAFHRIEPFEVYVPYNHKAVCVNVNTLGTEPGEIHEGTYFSSTYESDDETAWGYCPSGSDRIYFIRKDMTSYTGEPVDIVEVEETPVDRYFLIREGESVQSYSEPSETSTSSQLTIPGQVHVVKITANGFARTESGVYVKLSDVELDATEELQNNSQLPDMDRNYNLDIRGGSVTVWSHVMRDGTLVGRSFTYTEGAVFLVRVLFDDREVGMVTYEGTQEAPDTTRYCDFSNFNYSHPEQVYDVLEPTVEESRSRSITAVYTTTMNVSSYIEALQLNTDGTTERIRIPHDTNFHIIGMYVTGEDEEPTPEPKPLYAIQISTDNRQDTSDYSVLDALSVSHGILRYAPCVIFVGTHSECEDKLALIESVKQSLYGTDKEDNTDYTMDPDPIDTSNTTYSVWIIPEEASDISGNRMKVIHDINLALKDITESTSVVNSLTERPQALKVFDNLTSTQALTLMRTVQTSDYIPWEVRRESSLYPDAFTNKYFIKQTKVLKAADASNCADMLLHIKSPWGVEWKETMGILSSTAPITVYDRLPLEKARSLMLKIYMYLRYEHDPDEPSGDEPYPYWCDAIFECPDSGIPAVTVPETDYRVVLTSVEEGVTVEDLAQSLYSSLLNTGEDIDEEYEDYVERIRGGVNNLPYVVFPHLRKDHAFVTEYWFEDYEEVPRGTVVVIDNNE